MSVERFESGDVLRLFGQVLHYDWGSHTAIYDLIGEEATGQPAAELWFGTHPSAPSEVQLSGGRRPVEEIVGAMPFLLKVLAADRALSLQVHPDAHQARAGFDDEERHRVPARAPWRRYRDRNHKPELIVALTPFRALAGIRDPRRTLAVVHALDHPPLINIFAPLRDDSLTGAAGVLRTLLTMPAEHAGDFTGGLVAAAGEVRPPTGSDLSDAVDLIDRLAAAHPGDVGIAAALLLNDVVLQPGQALFQPARMLHAYVHGVGIEIMAASDNVLRGGLTGKHIDVDELLKVLDPSPTPAPVLKPRTMSDSSGTTVRTWDVPVSDFSLTEVLVRGSASADPAVTHSCVTARHPTVILAVDGAVTVRCPGGATTTLARGQAAVTSGPAHVSAHLAFTGRGHVFVAGPGCPAA